MAKKQVALKTTGAKKATPKTRLVLKSNKTATAMKSAAKGNLVSTAKKQTSKNVKLSPSDSKSVFGTDSSGKEEIDKIIDSRSKKDSKSVSRAGDSKFVRGRVKTAKTGGKYSLKVKKESPSSPKKSKKELKPSVGNQLSQKADTKSISDELTKLIKKLEVKKVGSTSKSPTDSKPRSSKKKQRITAKSQNYTLSKNIKYKTTPVIDLFEISKKNEYNSTDIILGILELGLHHQCYILPNSPKSTSFWEEIVQFNELKKLFQFLRPDTLKKYWRHLNYKNSHISAINLLKRYKGFLDEKKPK
jgi:hypothetical protein